MYISMYKYIIVIYFHGNIYFYDSTWWKLFIFCFDYNYLWVSNFLNRGVWYVRDVLGNGLYLQDQLIWPDFLGGGGGLTRPSKIVKKFHIAKWEITAKNTEDEDLYKIKCEGVKLYIYNERRYLVTMCVTSQVLLLHLFA